MVGGCGSGGGGGGKSRGPSSLQLVFVVDVGCAKFRSASLLLLLGHLRPALGFGLRFLLGRHGSSLPMDDPTGRIQAIATKSMVGASAIDVAVPRVHMHDA